MCLCWRPRHRDAVQPHDAKDGEDGKQDALWNVRDRVQEENAWRGKPRLCCRRKEDRIRDTNGLDGNGERDRTRTSEWRGARQSNRSIGSLAARSALRHRAAGRDALREVDC